MAETCPHGHGEMVATTVTRAMPPPGYMGETREEYGATPESNRSREVQVRVWQCATCRTIKDRSD